MTTVLRVLRLIPLAAWVGALVFFGFVAQVAFSRLGTHDAGEMVRGSLFALHRLGLVAGVLYLLLTIGLIVTQRDTHPARALEIVLIIAMMSLTAYSQFSVIPRMERDRIALHDDLSAATAEMPARRHFERLHAVSVKFESAVLIEGLLLLCLAPVHGRDDEYRFNT